MIRTEDIAIVEDAEAWIKAAVQILRDQNVSGLHILAALCITLADEAIGRKWTKEALKTLLSGVFDQAAEVNARLGKGTN